jgi:hypothetical protein
MKEERLKELIDRYYRGESTLEEEELLKAYFTGDEILHGYDYERAVFSFYSSHARSDSEPPKGLEARILSSLDKLEETRSKRFPTGKILIPLSLAATLLIITGSYFFFIHKAEPADTFTDPVLAYNETMKILHDVSVGLNKGTVALHSISKINSVTRKSMEYVDRSASVLNGNLERIRIIDKLMETDPQKQLKINK